VSTRAPMPGPSWNERGSLLRPRSPAFWLFTFLLAIGALGTGGVIAGRISAAPPSSLFAITLLIAWAVPLVVVIHALDLFEREPFGMLAAAFAWGSLAATTLAISANTALFDLIAKLGSQSLADRWGAAIAGPIDEETLKALGLLLLVLIAAAEIDTPIDGLIYGAFIGLGFQIVEDFQYLTNPAFADNGFSQTHVVWELFLVRGLVGGIWSHAAYTGLVGLGVGYLVSRPDVPQARRVTLAALAFAGAWTMHFVWNSPWLDNVFAGGFWRTIITQSIIKGLPGFLLLSWLYFRARRREARWVELVLTPETATGAVTPAEIESLLTFHGRRGERRAAKRLAGPRGARRTKELQRQQIGLAVDLTRSGGASTPQIERRRQAIESIRHALGALIQRQGPAGGARS
jgi:RsiW-degrading membrane proteinase PrsW (M82 family)